FVQLQPRSGPAGLQRAMRRFLFIVAVCAFVARAEWPFLRVRMMAGAVELIDPGEEPRLPLRYDYTRAPRSFLSIDQSGILTVRGALDGSESYAPPVAARWEVAQMTTRLGVTRIAWQLAEAHTLDDEKVTQEARA